VIYSSYTRYDLVAPGKNWDSDSNPIRTNLTKIGKRFGFFRTHILRIRDTTSPNP
jgi:hypothetical protein